MRAVVALALSAIIAGCVTARETAWKEATARHDVALAACSQQFKGLGTNVALAQCFAAASNAHLRPLFPEPDLLDVLNAKRTALATRLDQGTISKVDADVEIAQIKSMLVAESQRRSLARRAVAAQEAAATPICTRIGNSVACF